MYIRHLSLTDFRSWHSAELPLAPGPTVLLGRNGVGKTNLVEAAEYIATLSSHRVASDTPLIRRGAQQAVIRAAIVSQGRELLVEIEINQGKANRARINRSPQSRVRDILGALRMVLFAPEDLSLVRGDPSDRRRFLDDLAVMRTPRIAGVRADYDKIVRQRSTLLKTAGPARRRGGSLATLDVWDEHLAAIGAELIAQRLHLIDALTPHITSIYADIADHPAVVATVAYRSSLKDAFDPKERDEEAIAAALRAELLRRRTDELDRGVCLVGPHRDDMELLLEDGPAKGYASHGESWTFALALRLASFAVLRADGDDAILVLDDVFAELDPRRRDKLAARVLAAQQVIITAAAAGDVPEDLLHMTIPVALGHLGHPEHSRQFAAAHDGPLEELAGKQQDAADDAVAAAAAPAEKGADDPDASSAHTRVGDVI